MKFVAAALLGCHGISGIGLGLLGMYFQAPVLLKRGGMRVIQCPDIGDYIAAI